MNEAVKYLNTVSYADTGDDLETIETVTVSEASHACNLAVLQILNDIAAFADDRGLIYATEIDNLVKKYKKLV